MGLGSLNPVRVTKKAVKSLGKLNDHIVGGAQKAVGMIGNPTLDKWANSAAKLDRGVWNDAMANMNLALDTRNLNSGILEKSNRAEVTRQNPELHGKVKAIGSALAPVPVIGQFAALAAATAAARMREAGMTNNRQFAGDLAGIGAGYYGGQAMKGAPTWQQAGVQGGLNATARYAQTGDTSEALQAGAIGAATPYAMNYAGDWSRGLVNPENLDLARMAETAGRGATRGFMQSHAAGQHGRDALIAGGLGAVSAPLKYGARQQFGDGFAGKAVGNAAVGGLTAYARGRDVSDAIRDATMSTGAGALGTQQFGGRFGEQLGAGLHRLDRTQSAVAKAEDRMAADYEARRQEYEQRQAQRQAEYAAQAGNRMASQYGRRQGFGLPSLRLSGLQLPSIGVR